MKVSLNTIKQFIDFDLPLVDELVSRINQQLGGVEEVIDLAAKYKDAVIVRVVECEKHPDADRLNVTKIDDGGVAINVPRDENGLVQVVCGAPNVHADMFAVWLPPSSTVPASVDEGEPFVLDARKLRGVLSQGMLAAADELAIGSDHEGILEINPDEWKPSSEEITPGASFAKVYGLDDTIIDIENKMFTHRPDLFGQLGVAREIAGILGYKFTSPSWYAATPTFEAGIGLELEVFNDAGKKVPRVMFAAMKNVDIKPSPLWLQCALVAMGSKPINNIVDVTNYVMLLTAQPTHAYDYDKIRGAKIGARMAKNGEKITLLNGKEYELTNDDIVIADNDGPIGLGGIMGGSDSEVDENTTNIILEVATFDMYAVRKSSMRHGVFTDALTRFNKGQSPLQNDHIMNLLMMSIKDVSAAEQASEVYDTEPDFEMPDPIVETIHFINERLGLTLSLDEMKQLLSNVELRVSDEDGASHPNPGEKDYPVLIVMPPFWRTDLELPEDIVEEIGRLYGFDKLPRELPTRSITPVATSPIRRTRERIRNILAGFGANETLTYSFVHGRTIERAGQNVDDAYKISNALSPDLQYYRLSVLPSLLERVRPNIKAGYDEFALFEIGKRHNKTYASDVDELPAELSSVDIVYARKKPGKGAAFYHGKKLVDQLLDKLGIEAYAVPLDSLEQPLDVAVSAPFEPTRTAALFSGSEQRYIGVVGELKPAVAKAFKLPSYTAAASLELSELARLSSEVKNSYKPLSKFPSTQRDVTFKVLRSTLMRPIVDVLRRELINDQAIDVDITPVGVYQEPHAETKNITFRLKLSSYERTLVGDEVNSFVDKQLQRVCDQLQATIV